MDMTAGACDALVGFARDTGDRDSREGGPPNFKMMGIDYGSPYDSSVLPGRESPLPKGGSFFYAQAGRRIHWRFSRSRACWVPSLSVLKSGGVSGSGIF